MKITKIFKTESAHIVRSCSSQRCSHSIHGHSAVIELELSSDWLDDAQMVYDFGLMGGTIKQFIDSLDHCYLLCKYESEEFKNFIKANCDRWIELPFNPSAEMLSLFIFAGCRRILDHTKMANNEDANIAIGSVTYHETATGRATCDDYDFFNLFNKKYQLDDIVFSEGVTKEWSEDLNTIWFKKGYVYNPTPEHQISFSK